MADKDVPYRGQSVTRAQLALNRAAGVKHCYRCDGTKPFFEFAVSRSRSDNLNPVCRSCVASARRERAEKDPDWQRRQSVKWRKENPERSRELARARYHADIEHACALGRSKRAADPDRYHEHARQFREANREKCNEASRLAKRAKRAVSREADREYREKNKNKRKESASAYYAANRDSIRERERVNRLERFRKNPDLIERQRGFVRRYHAENPEKCREIRRNRKARIRGAEGKHTKEDIADIFRLQKGKCAHPWCRVNLGEDFHVDHIVAIARGGSNDRRNLQILCQLCNLKKGPKNPLLVARQNGMLL